jgi:adenylate kinase
MYYFLERQARFKRDFLAVYFDLGRDEAVKRLMARAEKEGRVDDTPELIATRIDLYIKETMPVIEHFQELGKLVKIDATDTIDEIADAVKQVVA